MPGEDQERFEDYLELEHFIEELQAGHVAHPPTNLTPAQARIYRMAALFRSASPEAAEPRPEFAQELHARLLAVQEDQPEEETLKLPAVKQPMMQKTLATPIAEEVPQEPQPLPVRPQGETKRAHFVSRRGLFAGGAVAAASLLIGAGAEHVIGQATAGNTALTQPTPTPSPAPTPYATSTPLVGDIPTTLYRAATLTQVKAGPVKFTTESVVGYVIYNDGDDSEAHGEQVIAVSAACTHMGCIVKWSDGDRQFHCPCHGGIFTEYGKASASGSVRYLKPLPRLKAHILDDNVYIEVPM